MNPPGIHSNQASQSGLGVYVKDNDVIAAAGETA